MANRELSWASGCSCGPLAVLRVVLALLAHFSGCWCLGGPLGLQGAVRLMPTRARASWEPPGVPLASTSGGNSILQHEQSISAAPKTSQSGEGGNHCRFSTWLLRHKLSPECWQIFQYQQLNPFTRRSWALFSRWDVPLCCPVPGKRFLSRKNNERCQSLCSRLSCSLGMSEQSLRNRHYGEKGD